MQLADMVSSAPGLRLVGVAGYEGVVANVRDEATLRAVDGYCRRTADCFVDLSDRYDTATPIFSMGGSAFPDRVVAMRPEVELVPEAVLLLRSGCYVTHDHGTYAQVSPIVGLRPAVTVQAVVLSAPEPDMVVIGAGKRESPHDAGMPVLLAATDVHGAPRPQASGIVSTLFDHHAVLTGARGIRVGDVVNLGVSHPCSAFARWDEYIMTSDGEQVGVGRTDFRRAW